MVLEGFEHCFGLWEELLDREGLDVPEWKM